MFTHPRQWIRGLKVCSDSRRCSRSRRRCAPPGLELLENRTLLNAGDLDPSFGTGGKVLTDFVGTLNAKAVAAVIQPDGRVVVAGAGFGATYSDFLLARYKADGSLDAGFGNGGKVNSEFFVFSSSPVAALALQSNGKIVVAGTSQGGLSSAGFPTDLFAVARYTANGSLDATFGSGGMVTTHPARGLVATGVVVQPDGKIIVVGVASVNNSGFTVSGALVRFNSDGQLDPTFGSGGTVISTTISPQGVVLQPDGKIVIAGSPMAGPTPSSSAVRYNPDGSLDGGFKASPLFPFPTALLLQGDGKIVLAGANVLRRLNSNGTLDNGFGDSGKAMAAVTIVGVALEPDGKIVVTGRSSDPGIAVARYNTDGSLDTGFGPGGKATIVIGSSDAPAAVAVQADGKLVIVGSTSAGEHTNYALARLNPDGSLDGGFASAGKLTTSFSGTVDTAATAVAVQPDGKIVVAGVFQDNFILTRYTANGNLDGAFANGGKIAIDMGQTVGVNSRVGVGIQTDGKIVVAGAGTLLRYNPDGTLDPAFGAGGSVSDMLNFVAGPVFESDGKILVLGEALIRFNPDGTPDTSFGTGGSVNVPGSLGVAIDPSGKIVVVHVINVGFGGPVAVTRYNPDGSPDPGFGTNGTVTSIHTIYPGAGSPLVAQPDGKIVLGTPALRYNADGSLDGFFGRNGRAAIEFSVSAMALETDGRIVFAGVSGRETSTLAVAKPTGSLDARFGTGGTISTDFLISAVSLDADGKILVVGRTKKNGRTSITVYRYLSTGGTSLSPNQLFVAQVYPDLLQRTVDPGGLSFWSGLLDGGASRAQVVQGIENSPEYHRVEASNLYRTVLARFADESGLYFYETFLDQGGTAEQLEAILLGSDEFFTTHGSDNKQGFLPALYQIVLQRPIDPAGAQAWGQDLQSGASSRQAVAAAVLASLESDHLEVQTLYMQFLHRPTDAGGLDTFTTALQRGVSNEQVAALLISSAEYFARV